MTDSARQKASFDDVARGYDARFTDQPITCHLRAEVMAVALKCLPASDGRVLEIGCGTGVDAISFARQGHRVLATDAAPGMIRMARQKGAGVARIDTEIWQVGQTIPEPVRTAAPFDLVFSNFGAVNCIEDLETLGVACAQLVAPGGFVVLVAINRWCLMEIVLGAMRLDRATMSRRFRKKQITRLEDGTQLAVQFPSRQELAGHMGDAFALEQARPVGVFFPPSEYYTAFQKRPWLMRLVRWLDAMPGRWWPFSRLADHDLLVFRRTADSNDRR